MKIPSLLLFGTLLLPAAPPSDFVRQPYLQLATDSSISIVWRTSSEMTPVVRWGSSPDQLTETVPPAQILTRTHPTLGGEDPLFKNAPV